MLSQHYNGKKFKDFFYYSLNLRIILHRSRISTAKVSIGTLKDTSGILVLEYTDKAMILPLIDSYESIINPSLGMIAYDLQNDLSCVFNEADWTFLAADKLF